MFLDQSLFRGPQSYIALLCCCAVERCYAVGHRTIVDPGAKKSEPRATKVERAGAAAEDISAGTEKPRKSPTGENATTERLASAKRDDEDLLCVKDLNRGTECVDDRYVGHKDPRTSIEALAMGNSAESANGMLILPVAMLHETQKWLQDSLQMTPRLPTEGKPVKCKQEVAESIVMVGRTNGMVETAEPVAEVDRMALLGREPAERACRVDEATNAPETIRTRRKRGKLPDSPIETTRWHSDNSNAIGNCMNRLNVYVNVTTSGDGIDSTRVNAVQLATESQHTRSSRVSRRQCHPSHPSNPQTNHRCAHISPVRLSLAHCGMSSREYLPPFASQPHTSSDDAASDCDSDHSALMSLDSFFESNGTSRTSVDFSMRSPSAAPSVFSMTSSMCAQVYKKEYGRDLNNYSDVYWLPADEEELERLGRLCAYCVTAFITPIIDRQYEMFVK